MQKTRVALLGGSFDPPTIQHMKIGAEIFNLDLADQVWYIPCGDRTDKQLTSTKEQRLEMTKMSVKNFFRNCEKVVKVDEIEIKNGASIPTYFLLKRLEEEYKDENLDFSWITGTDLIDDLELWDEGKKLKEEFKFIVIPRINETYKEENLPVNHQIAEDFTVGDLSSTRIRARLEEGRGVLGLMDPEVIEFVNENNLYSTTNE